MTHMRVLVMASATNECGKVAHPTRKVARRIARLFRGNHLRAYRCQSCQWWHLGHLGPDVIAGRRTADEIYRPTTREVTQ